MQRPWKWCLSMHERSRALLERIAEPAVLEELGETLLDCADGEAWLALLARVNG